VGGKLSAGEPGGPQDPVYVPHTELSTDALRGVVEAFVLREGTDYGEREIALEQKLAHVYSQLERGEAQIVFDPNTETVDIVLARAGTRPR
jgi:uncharacterized protein